MYQKKAQFGVKSGRYLLVVFCNECGALIMPTKNKSGTMQLTCSKCGWKADTDQIEEKYVVKEKIIHSPKDQTVVIDASDDLKDQYPVVDEPCRKCGHIGATYFESQDNKGVEYEPALFYRCMKCGYIWKS